MAGRVQVQLSLYTDHGMLKQTVEFDADDWNEWDADERDDECKKALFVGLEWDYEVVYDEVSA